MIPGAMYGYYSYTWFKWAVFRKGFVSKPFSQAVNLFVSVMNSIEKRLEEHYTCFCSMVDLIPAKYYLTKDPEAVQHLTTSKYWVNNKKSKTPKQSIKEATKRAKRIKLDPENEISVLHKQKEELSDLPVDDVTANKAGERLPGNRFSVETVRSMEFGDLRERLKVRIESLRGKRKIMEDEPEQIVIKKQKRIEMKKRKKEIQQKKKKKNAETESAVKLSEERPSLKAENGKIVFSKFDFRTAPSVQDIKPGKKDYRKLLAKAEATEKKLEELQKNDEKRGEELKLKLQWRKALDLAKGAKVKDDPKLLKKSLKRLDKKKAKSHKYWSEKNEQEAVQKDKKQEVRKKHIQERIDQIKAKKNKRKLKKGKPRTPGF